MENQPTEVFHQDLNLFMQDLLEIYKDSNMETMAEIFPETVPNV